MYFSVSKHLAQERTTGQFDKTAAKLACSQQLEYLEYYVDDCRRVSDSRTAANVSVTLANPC